MKEGGLLMPEYPTLQMAQKMVRNYRDDDFTLWIIEGNLRVGKSSYSVKNGLSVLDYYWGDPPVWDSIEPRAQFLGGEEVRTCLHSVQTQ